MAISLQIGLDAIASYKRLAYSPWHAIAELIDNSTQSYFNNQDALNTAKINKDDLPVTVIIDYNISKGVFRIEDNAMGMSYDELQSALVVAKPPVYTGGRY
jgi:HSP90 family molecular chaperone